MVLSTYAWVALSGVISHIAYFNRGEHHLYSPRYLALLFITIITGTGYLSWSHQTQLQTALGAIVSLVGSYLLGLYGSLLIYRIWIHPLCKFPGPFGASISSIWLSFQLKRHDAHLKLYQLHQKYGPYVRTGSSDLSIIDPQAIEAIYGSQSRCQKSEWYDFAWPNMTLQVMRDHAEHQARRRVWSAAFSDKLIRGYELRVRGYRQKLVDRLTEMGDRPIDLRKWFDFYSFDVMGDLSFGRGFGSIERGEDHWAIRLLDAAMGAHGFYLPPWTFQIFAATPGISGDFWKFFDFCGQRMEERLQNPPEIHDVSSALIAPVKGKTMTPAEETLLHGDARLIIVAGSDTTAGTLSTIFYQLARHPEEMEKLRAELSPLLDENNSSREFLHSDIAHLDHLNGIINECLRLHPAVPGALQRKTPPEGIVVNGVHIPGNITVYCPQYVIARSELSYERPHEFIPERWYKFAELIKNKAAFAPFSIGSYNCIGRPLALMNLRTTVARLVMEFDIKLAPGKDGSRFLGDAKDRFVIYYGELNMVLTRRRA